MKQQLLYTLFLGCFLTNIAVTAQIEQRNNCDYNIEVANYYRTGNDYIKKDVEKAIEFLQPCIEAENPRAQLFLGRIYISMGTEASMQKGFRLTQKAAKQNYAEAMTDLADLYKYGKGCELDYEKAKKWYRKSHKLGHDKGTYGLAYMHYKGLGSTSQNYHKAFRLFKQSNYPMAKHWLGVSYYFGHGTSQNQQKGLEILKNNPIQNSEVLVQCIEEFEKQGWENTSLEDEILSQDETGHENISVDRLQGTWKGQWVQLDYSGEVVERRFPVAFELNYNPQLQAFQYRIQVMGLEKSGVASYQNNTLQFDHLQIPLSRTFFNSDQDKQVDYRVLSCELSERSYKGQVYLTATMETFANQLQEEGTPFGFLVTKEKVLDENGQEVSEEVLANLLDQKDDVIKLYPNPFESDFYLSYSLDKPGNVSLLLSSIEGTHQEIVVQNRRQTAGEYIYHYKGSHLREGVYILSMWVDGQRKTKIIVKK